jgi:hypothetical protein
MGYCFPFNHHYGFFLILDLLLLYCRFVQRSGLRTGFTTLRTQILNRCLCPGTMKIPFTVCNQGDF